MKKFVILIIPFLLLGCEKNVNNIIANGNFLHAKQSTFEYGTLVKYTDIFNNDLLFEEEYLKTDTLGENDIQITYYKDNNKYVENYVYTIVDSTKPLVWLNSSYTVTKGYDKDLAKEILCADNADRNPNCFIKGEYDTSKEGSYELNYIAIDNAGNKENISFTLYVKSEDTKSKNKATSESTPLNDIIKKHKNDNTMIGIDVSKYQGEIDWKKVKEDGVEFAIIRLGTQWYFGDDNYIIDPYFESNIENALENNIKVGIYFYSYATSPEEGIKQAKFVIDKIKNYNITMPIAFDWESYKHWNELGISIFDLQSTSNAFQDTLKEHGYIPVQYGSKNYLNAFWTQNKYDTWLAHYTSKTNYDKDYIMWQICNNGKVNGINGDVDIDIFYNKS